jgi:hypothetical protein
LDPLAASTWSVVAILVIGFWIYKEFVTPIFGGRHSTIRVSALASQIKNAGAADHTSRLKGIEASTGRRL